MNAFEKFLLAQPRPYAIGHMVDCLRSGGEMAWQLMERINGKWSCDPRELPKLINETLNALEKESEDYDPTLWCNPCKAKVPADCDCGPIPEND